MKKLIAMMMTVAMVLTTAIPAFATDVTGDPDAAPAPVELTGKQVKAITPTGVKAYTYSYTKIRVTWDKIEGVDGYRVYRSTSKNGKYSHFYTASADKTQVINTKRSTGKTYYYKIRGYKKIGKYTYYTKYSPVTYTYARPNKVSITKVKCPKENCVRIYWNKVDGANGYQIYKRKKGSTTWTNTDYKNDKFSWSYSTKYNYATHMLTTFVTSGDSAYSKWEYKVRAYRTVNGKKIYGYFSEPKEYVPDWTIDEIYEELWKYGESLKFPLYEYANPDGSANEDGEVIVPKKDGSTYNFKHIVGWIDDDNIWGDEAFIYTNPKYGNTRIPSNFVKCTPSNMSWDVAFPERISYYDTKREILNRLKPVIKSELKSNNEANPVYWANAYIEGVGGPNDEDEYWSGVQNFSIYIEKDRNSYKIWSLW